MTNDEKAEIIAERNGRQRFCKNYDVGCKAYNSTDDCFSSAIQMAEWKDEQFAEQKQALINKACEWLNDLMFAFGYDAIDRDENLRDFKKAMEE